MKGAKIEFIDIWTVNRLLPEGFVTCTNHVTDTLYTVEAKRHSNITQCTKTMLYYVNQICRQKVPPLLVKKDR